MNSMAFAPEEKENMKKLLKFLVEDYDSEDYYNEVHITSDGYCTIVEWELVTYDGSLGGKFEYVDEDHEVLKQLIFPDNHYEYVLDCDEEKVLEEWLKEHPEYVKNEYGRWVNKEEQKAWEEYINGERE